MAPKDAYRMKLIELFNHFGLIGNAEEMDTEVIEECIKVFFDSLKKEKDEFNLKLDNFIEKSKEEKDGLVFEYENIMENFKKQEGQLKNELEETKKELEELKASNNEDLTPEELFKKKLDNIQESIGTVQTNPDGLQEEIKRRLEVNNNKRLNKDDYIYLIFYHWDTNKDGKFSIGEIIKFFLKIREFLKIFNKK